METNENNLTTNNPTIGTWDKIETAETERKPKVEFEMNKPSTVVFKESEPKEFSGDNGAYYIFDVKEDDEDKVIMTSAWTLLRALKKLSPLKDKKVEIVKKIDNNKQHFEAKELVA